METLRQDLAYGVRMLFKNPAFTAVAVLSLAIGIGANSAIFSVTNALLLRPLPYKNADRLVILWNRSPGLNIARDWLSPGEYLDIKIDNHVFDEVAITVGSSFNLTGTGGPEHVDVARVSSSMFSVLEAQPALGRVFLPEEDVPGKQLTVILTNAFWQRRFGGDPNIIGKTITLNGRNLAIVGVMPAGFSLNKEVMPTVNGIDNTDLLVPLPLSEGMRSTRTDEDFNVFGRLKPGVSVSQAQAEINTLTERMKQQYPAGYPANSGFMISVVPLLHQVVGDIRLALFVLFGAVGFVLLIACANVANLLLARASVRQKEIAIRTAVGAPRARILRQLLTESVVLALIGGVMGMAFSVFALKMLSVFGPGNIPRLNEIGIDGRVMAFTFGISLLTGIVFGLVPALRASRVDLNDVLKDGGRSGVGGGTFGSGHHKIRDLLVVAEIALSLVLLIGAGLLIRSYQQILNASPGFDSHNVVSMRLSLPSSKYSKADLINSFYKQVVDKVKVLPGIESAGTTFFITDEPAVGSLGTIVMEGYVPKNPTDRVISNLRFVSPGYFNTMGVPLLSGRYFDERDIKGAPSTAIINEALAQRFYPNSDPIGQRLQNDGREPWRTIVGVVRDTKQYDLGYADTEPPISVYLPSEQNVIASIYLVAKTSTDPNSMVATITKEIHSIDPELPAYDVGTMDQRLHDALARRRFAMLLLGVFAAFAMILAAIGIYGVMSYSVNQRTHEIGIRMALGAEQNQILKLVIRQSMILVSAGIAFGLFGAFFLTQFMSSMLYSVSTTDRNTFAGISLLLAFIAVVASYIPARRATKVDPMIALRYE